MKRNSGQISVFFGIMIMIILTLTALVVNVGLFVKAKINLQNAVDAAAWSGAAVQSRQLTNAAYLNWEMRNVYKEWMFKYYVLGNLGLRRLNGNSPQPLGQVSNFQMRSFDPALDGNPPPASSNGKVDQYNIPSICIQFAGTTNDCDLYKLPELPRFETSTSPGIAVTADVFLDNISNIRTKGCADKSRVNYEIATTWAYAVEGQSGALTQNAPQILAGRPGAFPKAYELAVRVRSVESLLNDPPKSDGICASQGSAAGSCARSITELANSDSPHLERSVKAFYSAYRNLGNESDNEMKSSFTLTEIPPRPESFATTTLSGLLYPGTNINKHYADLRLMPINVATFYTAFVAPPSSSNSGSSADGSYNNGTQFTGGCDATKVALPVPGYPLGFVKDPSMVTYYAVKGEANFVGLLNPLNEQFTKMTAYAAAKPFGGRIGPALFNTKNNGTLTARGRGAGGYLSRHYAAALSLEGATIYNRNGATVSPVPDFVLGAPVPIRDFWVDSASQALGGDPSSTAGGSISQDIRFSIPNLVWSAEGSTTQREELMNIIPGNQNTVKAFGLYNFAEYTRFKNVLQGSSVDPTSMQNAVFNLRAPTDYEAYNYLIPSPKTVNSSLAVASFAPIQNPGGNEGAGRIFAPLFSPRGNFPYSSISNFRSSFEQYLQKQSTAVEKYVGIMRKVALSTLAAGDSSGGFATDYTQAASLFSTLPNGASSDPAGLDGLDCDSIAGSFYQYFLGGTTQVATGDCPKPLGDSFSEYWGQINDVNPEYHNIENFRYFQNEDAQSFFTAYSPGPKYGADASGNVQHPVLSTSQNMIRNFYSTKLISISSILNNTSNSYSDNRAFNIFSSGGTQPEDDTEQNSSSLSNPADSSFIHHELGNYWK